MYMYQNVYAPCVCRYLLRPEEGERACVHGVLGICEPPSVGAGHQILAFLTYGLLQPPAVVL